MSKDGYYCDLEMVFFSFCLFVFGIEENGYIELIGVFFLVFFGFYMGFFLLIVRYN